MKKSRILIGLISIVIILFGVVTFASHAHSEKLSAESSARSKMSSKKIASSRVSSSSSSAKVASEKANDSIIYLPLMTDLKKVQLHNF